jgi:hypothetical protein
MVKRGYLTEKEMAAIESIAPSITQGSTHPLFMPDIMSGKMEFAGSLYKMAYRATAGVHKAVVKPALNGDFVPLAKWAAGGAIAGELQYFINYGLFGWEHPSGGNIDDFIEYLHGKDAPKEKFKESALRLGRNLVRAQSFGVFSDAFQGYGMYPVVFDAYKNVHTELGYLLTGKKPAADISEDFLKAQVALYRDWQKLQRARLSPRSEEYRRYGNVQQYVRKFEEDREGKSPKNIQYKLSKNSTSYREVEEAFWIADRDEMRRVMRSAAKTITQKNVAADMNEEIMTGKKARLEKIYEKDAQTSVKNIIKRMHPLDKLAGELRVEVDGKMRLLKTGSKNKAEARIFWERLTPREKLAVTESVDNYIAIIRELDLVSIFKK